MSGRSPEARARRSEKSWAKCMHKWAVRRHEVRDDAEELAPVLRFARERERGERHGTPRPEGPSMPCYRSDPPPPSHR